MFTPELVLTGYLDWMSGSDFITVWYYSFIHDFTGKESKGERTLEPIDFPDKYEMIKAAVLKALDEYPDYKLRVSL